ncbi:MAG: DUF421 domain-containing protein [Ferruginibacter sp.]|nr:DUF421 domain-containing protein [Ferruginibacter sp.]
MMNFFSELRVLSVWDLGQVEEAIVETSGSVGFFILIKKK